MKTWEIEKNAGLVVGNSCFAADVTPRGRLFGRIKFNPPTFEQGKCPIRLCGESGFSFSAEGITKNDNELSWEIIEHTYPVYRARAKLSEHITVSVEAFSPVSAKCTEEMFLPAIIVSVVFENSSHKEISCRVGVEWHADEEIFGGGEVTLCGENKSYYAVKSKAFLSLFGAEKAQIGDDFSIIGEVCVKDKTEISARLGCLFEAHRAAKRFSSIGALVSYLDENADFLKSEIYEFIRCVPNIGDAKIYEYTRWYMQAAVMLTKSTSSGEVITMGYNELNQRDSFWTSFLHLAVWPSLERNMIDVSCRYQREDGKIPTTILPLIEREYDIDINEYFCLRIARYYNFHGDKKYLAGCWKHYKKAVDWLLARDADGDFIPEQDVPENPECFWGDWKDVWGIAGRKLAPHFALLWLAVLKEGAKLASVSEDFEAEEKYTEIYKKAFEKINTDFEKGGMWKGDHYTEIWYDGRETQQVLQDQTVGIFFGVVPEERIKLIYDALSRGENKVGIPETFPPRKDFGYDSWMYHNGGVWPYLTFCDVMGRYKTGNFADAERLIKKVGYFDLEKEGDYSPNEYLHGQSGDNCGFEVQGWSSALYGIFMCGAFVIKKISEKTVEITINFEQRDFNCELFLPEGFGIVNIVRTNNELFVKTGENCELTVTKTPKCKLFVTNKE